MKNRAFAAYVHWPFCQSKCPYCDFNAHLVPDRLDQEAWVEAYKTEISGLSKRIRSRPLTSVFFGGGTPSLMSAQTVAHILDALGRAFGFAAEAEISLEANPGSADAEKFQDFASAGVNRFSLGVQALTGAGLAILGRQHSTVRAIRAVEAAQQAVGSVSLDLIYARPEQTLAGWRQELEQAVSLGADHLSCYQLTIEQGTRFEAMVRRGELTPLSADVQADFYELTNQTLKGGGFEHYEVSNYARPDHACKHNMLYWRYGEFAGIGPGAHGRVFMHNDRTKRVATRNQRMPGAWLDKISKNGHAVQEWRELSAKDAFIEALMMGLRLKEGVPWHRLASIDEAMTQNLKHTDTPQVRAFRNAGWLRIDDKNLALSGAGRQRMNSIVTTLLNAQHV